MINNFDYVEILLRQVLKLNANVKINVDTDLSMLGLSSYDKMSLAVEIGDKFNIPVEKLLPRHFSSLGSLCEGITQIKNDLNLTKHIPSNIFNSINIFEGNSENLLLKIIDVAKSQPYACCIVDSYGDWSYRDIISLATQVSNGILQLHPDESCRIALIGDRDHNMFAAYLGILLAGHTVVPLSLESPSNRNKSIIQLAEVKLILTTSSLEDIEIYDKEVSVFPVSSLYKEYSDSQVPVQSEEAYVIYTSGSTGLPKGVSITHGNIEAFINATNKCTNFTSSDVFLQSHELSFDLSVPEFWLPWVVGATINICTRMELLDLVNTINKYQITVLTATPALLSLILNKKVIPPRSMLSLKRIMICGEPLPVEALHILREAAPNAVVDNYYGPTEATVWCMQFSVPSLTQQYNFLGSEEIICPIGNPLPGFEISYRGDIDKYVTNENYYELLLSGPQVFKGYLGESHCQPFIDEDSKTWYCTGDIVKKSSHGYMRFCGRIDNQIKTSGYRVDLEEVECAVMSVVKAPAGACIIEQEGVFVIAVAIVAEKIDPDYICDALASIIPKYMIPRMVCKITDLPLTVSNKLDRKELENMILSLSFNS